MRYGTRAFQLPPLCVGGSTHTPKPLGNSLRQRNPSAVSGLLFRSRERSERSRLLVRIASAASVFVFSPASAASVLYHTYTNQHKPNTNQSKPRPSSALPTCGRLSPNQQPRRTKAPWSGPNQNLPWVRGSHGGSAVYVKKRKRLQYAHVLFLCHKFFNCTTCRNCNTS